MADVRSRPDDAGERRTPVPEMRSADRSAAVIMLAHQGLQFAAEGRGNPIGEQTDWGADCLSVRIGPAGIIEWTRRIRLRKYDFRLAGVGGTNETDLKRIQSEHQLCMSCNGIESGDWGSPWSINRAWWGRKKGDGTTASDAMLALSTCSCLFEAA